MPTVSRDLPDEPRADVPGREADELLEGWRAARPDALDRIRRRLPRLRGLDDAALASAAFAPGDARAVVAREYGSHDWDELMRRIAWHRELKALDGAIRSGDVAAVTAIVRAEPGLLAVPVRSGNWGPPLSHAANLGQLAVAAALVALGARDVQRAFDRAVLRGQLECARWLHGRGAVAGPGMAMGPCETLNAAGLELLVELGAPLADASGDRLAPVALALETYSRNPEGKHRVLELLEAGGCALPDTPMMAFHRGDVAALARHAARDPGLLRRRFALAEIYPPGLGCGASGAPGMHGTPIDGGTLLHLAVDFDEAGIFRWLLENGADPDARASVDAAGFGGHTPLFNAVVGAPVYCGRQRDAAMARGLLGRGASPAARASLRKFLDWQAEPGWHEARDVTPSGWARGFPIADWVNPAVVALLGGDGGVTSGARPRNP